MLELDGETQEEMLERMKGHDERRKRMMGRSLEQSKMLEYEILFAED
jgi:hypothetical protein